MPIDYQKRRQRLFLLLSGLFLGTLAMLNILGLTRFLDLSFNVFGLQIPMVVAVGVLPYPITFMCTDLISELYGEKKARDLVWIGLILNVWVLFIIWLGSIYRVREWTRLRASLLSTQRAGHRCFSRSNNML